eukprot:TRINITY_DN24855_c0_g1_i1.p1 TRINITY_DN24855_c0_g1~~TRINITY_DN24855_c0_g1_i1.p1  ORF type:complete len:384 (+),score=82.77 TRINITY_DN24855_c0_g1_i1:128-1279(+)
MRSLSRAECLAFAAGAGAASVAWGLALALPRRRRPADEHCAVLRGAGNKGSGRRFVGIDLGGTTLSVIVAEDHGRILARSQRDLPQQDRAFQTVVAFIVEQVVCTLCSIDLTLADVSAIGIGAPGNLDCERGIVRSAANFDWKGVPLGGAIAEATGVPTRLENDAKAAVLAEWWVGAGAGDDIRHLVMFTLGTGIGGGVVSDDRIIRGATGMAGELGHAIIEPGVGANAPQGRFCAGTGVHGVLEQYASARALGERAREAFKMGDGAQSSLASVKEPTSKDVCEHAKRGDALALRLLDETADYLAVAFINACRAYDPQLIVITGGLANAGDVLLEPLRHHFRRRWWSIQPQGTCRIELATTGNDAGTLGAAAAARSWLDSGVR